jgi:cytochrome c peroxidase
MGLTMDTLESRVRSLPYYKDLFKKAFGSPRIDTVRIALALSQFVRTLVTCNARYDRVKQGLDSFTAEEARGDKLFTTARQGESLACASCHTPPMFLTDAPAAPYAFPFEKTGIRGEARFKAGSLRNIAVRRSLFHKGTVPDVTAMLRAGSPGSELTAIPLHSVSQQDIPALLAFLQTLTDDSITVDPKFADPFR